MNNFDRLDFTADPAVIDAVEKNSPHGAHLVDFAFDVYPALRELLS
ncbi:MULTISPECIES: hypothetical protein [Burkholderia]|nr:hypothetical protein [Burkholderia seminalis]